MNIACCCQFCGNDTSSKRKDRRAFCNQKCNTLYRQKHDPKWAKIKKRCKQCDKEFEATPRNRNIYCSSSCAATFNNTGRKAAQNRINKVKMAYKDGRLTGLLDGTRLSKETAKKKREDENNWIIKECSKCHKIYKTYFKNRINKNYCSRNCYMTSKNIGGYFPGSVRSYKSGFYESKIAGKVWLDSSCEFIMAQYLDSKNYTWNKNHQKFPYVNTKGESKNYVPDFYVKDWDLWIETKGLVVEDDYLKWKSFPNTLKIIKKCDIKHPETWGF